MDTFLGSTSRYKIAFCCTNLLKLNKIGSIEVETKDDLPILPICLLYLLSVAYRERVGGNAANINTPLPSGGGDSLLSI